jgi:phospholipase/lecithinase/hemolysin
MQTGRVKRLVRFTLYLLLFGPVVNFQARAAFSSIYIFGDSVSCTASNTSGLSTYWGKRFTNGRVWVEVLAQRQNLTNNSITNISWSLSSNNLSYFNDYSTNMLLNVSNFVAPPNISSSLFVIWVNDADMYGVANTAPPADTNAVTWTNVINACITNHFKAVTNLYAKGARTIMMPSAVDVTLAPFASFKSALERAFIRQEVINFNNGFSNMLARVRTNCPNLTIYSPDFFTLFDAVMAHPGDYGMTITNIGALQDVNLSNKSFTGLGANYVWWDQITPGSKFQTLMADTVQQAFWPAQIISISAQGSSNELDVINIPVGKNGVVEGSASLASWSTVQTVNSTNTPLSILAPASGAVEFYRLRFPFSWTWP